MLIFETAEHPQSIHSNRSLARQEWTVQRSGPPPALTKFEVVRRSECVKDVGTAEEKDKGISGIRRRAYVWVESLLDILQ